VEFAMTAKPPPVPPANRSPKGPQGGPEVPTDTSAHENRPSNLAEQDRQGNIKQNTTNQGYQQDR
jgi:hypothetical protein